VRRRRPPATRIVTFATPSHRSGNRQRRLLDHDGRAAAVGHEALQRLTGEREAEGGRDRGGDVAERLAGRRRPENDVIVANLCDDDSGVCEQWDAQHEASN
jgi:hypothetical protein